jgi:16S rRNA (uracil1498-N3)-methyltransferase
MRIPRIYTDSELAQGKQLRLDKSSSSHLVRVLRLKAGASLVVFNGRGGHFQSVIDNIQGGEVDIGIGQYIPDAAESPLKIILAQGISRGERMDYTIQKSVELGVNTIIPLLTERCGVKLNTDRADKRLRHWRGVITAACEQCGRDTIPDILPVTSLDDWLLQQSGSLTSNASITPFKLVLDYQNSDTLKQHPRPDGPIILLIGPEGGLTVDELQTAYHAGYAGIRLGPRVLRTETAGIAAVSTLQALWGDLA